MWLISVSESVGPAILASPEPDRSSMWVLFRPHLKIPKGRVDRVAALPAWAAGPAVAPQALAPLGEDEQRCLGRGLVWNLQRGWTSRSPLRQSRGNGARVAAKAGGPPAPWGSHSSRGPLARAAPGRGGGQALGFQLEPLRPASCSKSFLRPGRAGAKWGLYFVSLVREPTSAAMAFPRPWLNPCHFRSCLPESYLRQVSCVHGGSRVTDSDAVCSSGLTSAQGPPPSAFPSMLHSCPLAPFMCQNLLFPGGWLQSHFPEAFGDSLTAHWGPFATSGFLLQLVRTSSTFYFIVDLFVNNC